MDIAYWRSCITRRNSRGCAQATLAENKIDLFAGVRVSLHTLAGEGLDYRTIRNLATVTL